MRKLVAGVLLSLAVFLGGCTNPWTEEEPPIQDHVPNINFDYTNGIIHEDPVVPDTPVSEEIVTDIAPGDNYVRSDLTGQWITRDNFNTRVLAVMIPNNITSLPHYNLSKAGVLYECNVEGELTRFMALYDDWTTLERIGCVRSARDYFVNMAMEWDALFLHVGHIWYANEILSRYEVCNIDGLVRTNAVYRVTTENRQPDQSVYANGFQIKNGVRDYGYSLTHDEWYQGSHFSFAPTFLPTTLTDNYGNIPATYVSLEEAYPIDKPYFIYNPEDELYYRYEYFEPHIDGIDQKQLSFSNIIIQNTYYEYRQDGSYLIYRLHDTTEDGWFITRGKAVHVTWRKEGTYGITKYYDDNGDEIILNQGKTMICIVQAGDKVTIQ